MAPFDQVSTQKLLVAGAPGIHHFRKRAWIQAPITTTVHHSPHNAQTCAALQPHPLPEGCRWYHPKHKPAGAGSVRQVQVW